MRKEMQMEELKKENDKNRRSVISRINRKEEMIKKSS